MSDERLLLEAMREVDAMLPGTPPIAPPPPVERQPAWLAWKPPGPGWRIDCPALCWRGPAGEMVCFESLEYRR